MERNYVVSNQNPDTSSLKAWMTSIGLPMYHQQLTKVGIRTLEGVKRISPNSYDQLQFRLPLHSLLFQKAVHALYKN